MINASEQTVSEVVEIFKGIYDLEDTIAEYKETLKDLNKSAKKMKEMVAEKLDFDKKSVARAYKNWVFSIENPGVYDESEMLVESLREEMNKEKLES